MSCWPENKIDITLFFYFCKPLVSECLNSKKTDRLFSHTVHTGLLWLCYLLSRNYYKTKGQLVDLFFLKRVLGPFVNIEAVHCHTVQHSSTITRNITAVILFYSHILVCMYFSWVKQEKRKKKKQNENQHVDMGKQSTNINIFGYKLWNCS